MRAVLHSLLLLALATVASSLLARESLTLRKIKETGVVSIGYRDGSIPFSYLDERQRPIGYVIDICQHIVGAVKQRLQLEEIQIKYTPVNSATRIPMVANDTIDLECGTTSNTMERQRHVAFSITTFVAASRFAAHRSAPIEYLEDLRGKTVVSTAGTTSIALLVGLNASQGLAMNILAAKDHQRSFATVETNRAAAFAMDDVLLFGLIAAAKDPSSYVVSGPALSVEPYGIMLRKGDQEFKALVDATITSLFKSGEITAIYHKWFETPIPVYQVNLALPMSPIMKSIIASPTDSGDPLHYR